MVVSNGVMPTAIDHNTMKDPQSKVEREEGELFLNGNFGDGNCAVYGDAGAEFEHKPNVVYVARPCLKEADDDDDDIAHRSLEESKNAFVSESGEGRDCSHEDGDHDDKAGSMDDAHEAMMKLMEHHCHFQHDIYKA